MIFGLIDHAHAAAAEFLDDAIVGDGEAEIGDWVSAMRGECSIARGGKSTRAESTFKAATRRWSGSRGWRSTT